MIPARRARLSWLHRWAGLVCGWLSFVIFVNGTLCLFDTEITRWMQPETAAVPRVPASDAALEAARRMLLADEKAGRPQSFLLLPSARDPALRVEHFEGHSFQGPVLDPRDGRIIPARRTEGGALFFDLHESLRLPAPWGERVVAVVTFVFALLLVSGVLLHLRRLIPDYFTLRLRASSARFLLDLHVLTGTAVLPFHLMIAYTGLLLLDQNALPLLPAHEPAPAAVSAVTNGETGAPPHWAPAAPLGPMLRAVRARGAGEPRYILFPPGSSVIYGARENVLSMEAPVTFDSATGQERPAAPSFGGLAVLGGEVEGLHLARSFSTGMRWLWFAGGAAASVLIASGMIFYAARSPGSLVARLNAGVMGGLVAAAIGYLWANRLIPASWPGRSGGEIGAFFLVWGLCLLPAASGRRRVPPGIVALLGLGLPLLDLATGPGPHGVFLAVDLTGAAAGLFALRMSAGKKA